MYSLCEKSVGSSILFGVKIDNLNNEWDKLIPAIIFKRSSILSYY